MKKLTQKQKRFCDEYLIDLNATQAAIRAGYSPASAYSIGPETLNNPVVRACVDKALAERSKRTGVNADRVITELAKIAFSKLTDVVDPDTCQILESATDEDLACIESVKVKSIPTQNGMGFEREIKMSQKIKAIELLGKHLGMFADKVKIEGALPVVISGEDELED